MLSGIHEWKEIHFPIPNKLLNWKSLRLYLETI